MEYRRLGKSGLQVSQLALGCMSYGDRSVGRQPWALGLDEARPFFRRAVEAGINFFDTADTYSWGTSEEYTGKLVAEFLPRDRAVIATKVYFDTRADLTGNERGLSRKHIMSAVDASLKRLGTDYIDLYQIHRFDRATPIEETMRALDDIVRAGKVRYLGASSMHAYQFVQMQELAERNGLTKFVSMQNLYNLLWREEEKQMNAYCIETGVGLIPWSPIAGGFLAVDWRTTGRKHSDRTRAATTYASREHGTPEDYRVVDALIELARDLGRPMSEVALAWVLSRPGVTAPIIGATKPEQMESTLNALTLTLTQDSIDRLDRAYTWSRALGMLT